MPNKNFLSSEEKEYLQQGLKKENRPEVRERILIFLLENDGKNYQEIANFLGCSPRTVAYWAVHGSPSNLETLQDKRIKGNHKKATDEYIDLLLRIVDKNPTEFGYEFGRWTGKRLSEHLEKETGIKLSKSQIVRILKRKKYVYIWAKYSLEDKQNQEKREVFKEKLDEYMRRAKSKPNHLQLWFWDECGFSLRVIRRRTWIGKGKRKKVSGQRRRGRVNMMGGLRYSDKKRICFLIKKGDSSTFYEQLKKLNKLVKQEWISQGNREEDFEEKGTKILIVLDNASFHKKKEILKNIENNLPNIILEFLPAYSPDYNLIELVRTRLARSPRQLDMSVWHSAKEYIAHREFENKEQLAKVVNNLLNEGELTINWSKKFKNKGNLVNAM
jgi:transposase